LFGRVIKTQNAQKHVLKQVANKKSVNVLSPTGNNRLGPPGHG
jgi:hypothetical protein